MTNPRMKLVYNTSLIVIAIYLFWQLTWKSAWSTAVLVGGEYMNVNLAVWGADSPGTAFAADYEAARTALCSVPGRYDWEDDSGQSFTNHVCPSLCASLTEIDSCLSPYEMYKPIYPDEVYVLSHKMIEDLQHPFNRSVTNLLYPSAHLLGVSLTYSYSVPMYHIQQSVGVPAFWDMHNFRRSSLEDLTTVIVDSQGQFVRQINPGGKIELSMAELLSLTGESDFLDNPQSTANSHGLTSTPPKGRITGRQLALDIQCFNRESRPTIDGVEIEWNADMCRLQVVMSPEPWEEFESVQRFGDSLRREKYHGLRIKYSKGGNIRLFDAEAFLTFLISVTVLMQIPRSVIRFFMTKFLGHTSIVYCNALNERFHLGEQVAGLASRMMGWGVAYLELENSPEGITKHRMKERLEQAVRNRGHTLDASEVSTMVDFCFKNVKYHQRNHEDTNFCQDVRDLLSFNEDNRTVRRSLNQRVSRAFVGIEEDIGAIGGGPSEHVSIDDFLCACSSSDKLSFDHCVKLFDKNRSIGFFEKYFMPSYMKRALFAEGLEDPMTQEQQDATALAKATYGEESPRSNDILFRDDGCDSPHETPVRGHSPHPKLIHKVSLEEKKQMMHENHEIVRNLQTLSIDAKLAALERREEERLEKLKAVEDKAIEEAQEKALLRMKSDLDEQQKRIRQAFTTLTERMLTAEVSLMRLRAHQRSGADDGDDPGEENPEKSAEALVAKFKLHTPAALDGEEPPLLPALPPASIVAAVAISDESGAKREESAFSKNAKKGQHGSAVQSAEHIAASHGAILDARLAEFELEIRLELQKRLLELEVTCGQRIALVEQRFRRERWGSAAASARLESAILVGPSTGWPQPELPIASIGGSGAGNEYTGPCGQERAAPSLHDHKPGGAWAPSNEAPV